MKDDVFAKLGTPDLKLEGLRIWVHGRQYPDLHDYWDGNWIRVTAHCRANGASVFATGPIIHLPELDDWRSAAEELWKNLTGEANLVCAEPELSVNLRSTSPGHIAMEVSITPDHLVQRHWFRCEIDQSYLTPFIRQCRSILEVYPIRGDRGG